MSNKAKFSAAMLALLAAGASAPVLFDQFISEKEGNALVAVVDPGVWSLCHGVTVIDGKRVIQGKEQLRNSAGRLTPSSAIRRWRGLKRMCTFR
jgi:GH24 family phage-related lysozyme (muramidase)